MRRSIARGRVFPQSFSTDRRYGRLSLGAVALFPLVWVNCDDQGRICGDPEEIKYTCCPNVDHIPKADVEGLLQEMEDQKLILRYESPKGPAIQILDWWDSHQKLQWAWPSDYAPSDGWPDHLRYKKDAKTVVTVNWPVSGETSPDDGNGSQVREYNVLPENSGDGSGEDYGIPLPPQTPPSPPITVTGKGRGRGKRNSPEDSGDTPTPTAARLSRVEKGIYDDLLESFRIRWGNVSSQDRSVVNQKEPDFREKAMLRDLAKELSAAGGCEGAMVKQAFDEAGGAGKYHIPYVRKILLDWLGVEDVRPRR